MRLLACLLLFIISHLAYAGGIKVTSVSNASSYDITTDINTPIIFGGLAGTCSSPDSSSTCNSCTSGDMTLCNNFRIHDSLVLRISFTVTAELTGKILMTKKDGETSLASMATIPSGTFTTGDSSYVEITWSSLCSSLDSSTTYSCDNPNRETEINETIYIGIDGSEPVNKLEGSEYTPISIRVVNPAFAGGEQDAIDCSSPSPSVGICNFIALPGDEKVIIEENSLESINGFPATTSTTIEYLRLFYSTTGFDSITNTTTTYKDLKLEENGSSILNGYVEGFTNDTTYFFKIAAIDKAKNVFAFTADSAIEDPEACGATPSTLTAADDLDCPMIATPAEVFGLLTEDLNCFITTATYGSSFHSKVKDFREFRNNFLIPSKFGRIINNYYYKFGPYAAHFISKNEPLKAVSRVVLIPAWIFAKTSLKYGLFVAFSSVIFFLFLGFATIHTIIKRRRQRTVGA